MCWNCASLAPLTFCKTRGNDMRSGKQQAGRSINLPYGLDDPAAADVVRRIFAEFCNPYARFTLSEIARALNVDEMATRHGKRWHASTVKYILCNGAYADMVGVDTWQAAQRRLRQLRPGPAK